jgi:hypothetical protein
MICTNVTEYLQAETDEGIRLSEIYADDFQSYLDRWVKYWPHSADPGYHRRLSYHSGFIKPRRSALGGPFLIEAVERHLNYDTWAEWRYHQGRPARQEHGYYWLGLHAPGLLPLAQSTLRLRTIASGTLISAPIPNR